MGTIQYVSKVQYILDNNNSFPVESFVVIKDVFKVNLKIQYLLEFSQFPLESIIFFNLILKINQLFVIFLPPTSSMGLFTGLSPVSTDCRSFTVFMTKQKNCL